MIEAVAEMDDELTHKYLEGEELTVAEIKRGLRLGTLTTRIIPVLTGSALKNKGVQKMLDAVVDYLPSPLDVPPMIGLDPKTGAEIIRTPDDSEPFSALAFKIAADPFVGKLAFFRVYSGTLKAGSYVYNPAKDKQRADRPHPPDARQPPRGDRRCLRRRHRRGRRAQGHLHRRHPGRPGAPDHPRVDDLPGAGHRGQDRAEDEGRPGQAGASPSSAWPRRTRPSGSTPTRSRPRRSSPGMGELHLDVLVDRMIREFKVAANIGKPQVSYRETIRRAAEGNGRFVRQTGGKGQYGHADHQARARTRRAPATSSSTRSSAARSRASTSSRSTRASARRSPRASTPASRSSTSR